jgi:hypothetical protein
MRKLTCVRSTALQGQNILYIFTSYAVNCFLLDDCSFFMEICDKNTWR